LGEGDTPNVETPKYLVDKGLVFSLHREVGDRLYVSVNEGIPESRKVFSYQHFCRLIDLLDLSQVSKHLIFHLHLNAGVAARAAQLGQLETSRIRWRVLVAKQETSLIRGLLAGVVEQQIEIKHAAVKGLVKN
jgi:hypothetical protein